MTKICSQCGAEKPTTEFYTKASGRIRNPCKTCKQVKNKLWNKANPERVRAASRKRHADNPEVMRGHSRKWQRANREKCRSRFRLWQERNREKIRKDARLWRTANPDKIRDYHNRWRLANPEKVRIGIRNWWAKAGEKQRLARFAKSCRARILQALKGESKSASSLELLGCSVAQLKAHIEGQFQPGMTWENRGFRGWHLDHIKPCSKFDLTDAAQQKLCFHFSNLQPLWATANLKKHASYAGD